MTTCDCEKNVSMYRKRNRTIKFTITGPGDLTSAKFWFSVKTDKDDTDEDALIMKKSANNDGSDEQIKVTDGPNGVVEVYIVPEDTDDIEAGSYLFDLVLETEAGRRLQGVPPSSFKILQPTTLT